MNSQVGDSRRAAAGDTRRGARCHAHHVHARRVLQMLDVDFLLRHIERKNLSTSGKGGVTESGRRTGWGVVTAKKAARPEKANPRQPPGPDRQLPYLWAALVACAHATARYFGPPFRSRYVWRGFFRLLLKGSWGPMGPRVYKQNITLNFTSTYAMRGRPPVRMPSDM